MMRKLTILLSLLCLFALPTFAQWESINPGAGGQVQDLVCDPNTPNRVILASDMEGIYETTDNGNTWHHKGNLKQNRVYAVGIPQGNSSKMFVGTLYGLEVSNDGGNNFSIIGQTKKMSIGAIAVDPNNQNNAIAGVGWRDDSDFAGYFGLSQNGPVVLYRTINGGSSWTTINITNNQSANRNVYTIQYDKNNSNNVYMGTAQGVYKSTNGGANWFPLGNDPGTNSGVSLSANGQYLYGTFNHDLYVTSTSSINWQQKMSGVDGNAKYWYPEVDPRSTGSSHKVTMAILGDRPGLYEGTFNWSGNNVSSYSWKKIWDGQSGYDTGWDQATPNPRVTHYTPANWGRAIWSTTNQTIFQATPNSSTWGWAWNNKYCNPNYNYNLGGSPTYSSKGTASTYTYDVVAHDNYVIQAMADNGWVESWDNGFSWSNAQMRWAGQISDIQAVDIGYANGKSIVVSVGSPSCYGGICNWSPQSSIWVKVLNSHSTSDSWVKVPGTDKGYDAGFYANEGRYREVAVSPAKKDRVFFGVNNEGLYMIDDLWASANGSSNLQFIGGSGMWIRSIAPHPTNPDIFFFTHVSGGNQGLYKATKSGGSWSITSSPIVSGSGWDSDVYAWMNGSQVMVAYAANIGGQYKYMLSNDGGNSFNTVMTPSIAQGINTPSWYSQVSADYTFSSKGGVAGDGNTMFAVYYDHKMQQPYGIYKGTVSGNNVSWQDWTDGIEFGGLTGARVIENSGKKYLYASTAGGGAIRREITGGSTQNQAPVVNITSPSNNANFLVGNNITVNYTATDDNAVTKVELYVGSTLVSTDNSAPFNSLTWNNTTQGSGQYLSIVAYDAANLTTTKFIQVNVNAAGGGTSYRYLMISSYGGSVGNPINIQNIWWGSGPAGYPWPALTSTSTAVYGSPDASNAYRAYDNTTAGWVVGNSATSWLWLDLGAGNAINPDKISIKPNAPDRGFKNFQCYGSNDSNDWVLLHEETNLTTASYSNGGWGVFNFSSGSRKIGNPEVYMVADLKLYPNPMTIGSDLTIDASQISKFSMQIIGLDGKLIFEKQFSSVESSVKINIPELNQTGVYLVKFNNGMKQWAQRLIVK